MQDKSIYASAPKYYHYYFDLIESNDLLHELKLNEQQLIETIATIPDSKWHMAYAEGKWTAAEVVRHIIETERIFAYRALRFSRFDATPLPGFDENKYIAGLDSMQFSKAQITREFQAVRQATLSLFETMNAAMLGYMGNANGTPVSTEMLGYMIAGHTAHHAGILRERYL
jgi:uncharacterized damage-inducible protein DinB